MTRSSTSISASAPSFRNICRRTALLAVVACALSCLAATPARASDGGKPLPATAIVVDVQKILDGSDAAKGVKKQLDAQRSRFQGETEKEENKLRQAEQELAHEHERLSAKDYDEHEQQLRQRFIVVERHVEARRKALDQSFTDSMDVVRDRLMAIVQTVAREKGANLVLVKQQILWSSQPLDVTDEILLRLNKELPKVAVKTTEEEGPKE